jgi:hypothetical protein
MSMVLGRLEPEASPHWSQASSLSAEEIVVGAVIVRDGKVLAKGRNLGKLEHDSIARGRKGDSIQKQPQELGEAPLKPRNENA